MENIYTLLANFEKVYDKISDEEKKSLISSLIKEIEIFPCDEAELPLKSILFNFPVYKDGGDVYEFLWDKSTHISTCVAISPLYYMAKVLPLILRGFAIDYSSPPVYPLSAIFHPFGD